MPDNELTGMLHWNFPTENIERRVAWWERIARGTIRWRQLTVRDNEDFCELWANSPEDIGDWQVTVERGPNGCAQFELQERPVLNALFDGLTMVACVSFSLRETVVAGKPLWIRYGQAMRVHKDHRRHGYGNWVRSLPWAIGINRPTQVQYDYLRSHNMTMEAWNRKMMPHVETVPKREDEVPGVPVPVLQFPAKPTEATRGVRPAREGDLDRCIALINRTHAGRDLFRPYPREFLRDRLAVGLAEIGKPFWSPPYGTADVHVLERDGEIVACAGLWDRGRDLRERWRHRETGEARVVSATAVLDFGCAEGREDALAALIEHLIGATHALGRDYLLAPLETVPRIAELLASHDPVPEVRYLQWRADTPAITTPVHVDLVYW
jgi:GNAT superfamily N-acetyltransferase